MKIMIVYESMYGNTHLVAEKMAEGASLRADATLVPVSDATAELIAGADLLVVGGPTHLHGLSSSMSRRAATADAAKRDQGSDPDAETEGLRSWFHSLSPGDGRPSAAFDTRLDGSAAFTGRASPGIARRLHHHGFRVVVDPESFIVDKENHLIAGEGDRARAWADGLVSKLTTVG